MVTLEFTSGGWQKHLTGSEMLISGVLRKTEINFVKTLFVSLFTEVPFVIAASSLPHFIQTGDTNLERL